jgi:hypothetical protein
MNIFHEVQRPSSRVALLSHMVRSRRNAIMSASGLPGAYPSLLQIANRILGHADLQPPDLDQFPQCMVRAPRGQAAYTRARCAVG